MILSHLRLVNFRNHRRTDLTLGPRLNLVVGANAQGKTALLEAVEVAATGRSHRTLRDAELICVGEQFARVRVTAARSDREVELDIGWRVDVPAVGPGVLKEMRVNGVPVRRGELFGHTLVVIASPQDELIIVGGPALRRRLVDVLLAQLSPSYFYTAARYTRAVAQRNRALRDRASGMLEAWDDQVAELGAGITARRKVLIARLAGAAREAYAELCGDGEQISLIYAPSIVGDDETEMVGAARELLVRRRAEELARGATLTGPHRDDFLLQIEGRDIRGFGSRGQQHAAMLAIRLAERAVLHQETGEEPILLLDDTLLALDEGRQANLMRSIAGAQALVTVTTLATIPAWVPGSQVFRVAGGTVEVARAHLT